MRKIVCIAIIWAMALGARAQTVTFYSVEFEEGVREHLKLGETDDVLQSQMDTITAISLSGLGITDVRDAVYLPNVKKLDLSYNEIDDVSALLPLDSLHVLNLSNNQLESINILAFSRVDTMEIDVTNNYIGDFSYFFTPTECEFTLVGMAFQQDKNAPYFDVHQLYADINDEGTPIVNYRGYTNMEAAASVACLGSAVTAVMDGECRTVGVPGQPETAALLTLSNGERGDTTWVVPPQTFKADANETVSIATGLPEGYAVNFSSAHHGTVEIDGTTLRYTAPDEVVGDTIYFSYYEGRTLRGFSQCYVNVGPSQGLRGDVNNDGVVTIADVTALVNIILGKETQGTVVRSRADVNGDGTVTIADVTALVNMILGKE